MNGHAYKFEGWVAAIDGSVVDTHIGERGPRCGEHALASLDRECHTVRRLIDVVGQYGGGSDHLRVELAD